MSAPASGIADHVRLTESLRGIANRVPEMAALILVVGLFVFYQDRQQERISAERKAVIQALTDCASSSGSSRLGAMIENLEEDG